MIEKIKIKWPKRKMIVSKKDKKLKSFQNFCETDNFLSYKSDYALLFAKDSFYKNLIHL